MNRLDLINKDFEEVQKDWEELNNFIKVNSENLESYKIATTSTNIDLGSLKHGDIISMLPSENEIKNDDITIDYTMTYFVTINLKNGESKVFTKTMAKKALKK